MKKVIAFAALLAIVAPAAADYYAGTVKLTDSYGDVRGGEFIATPSGFNGNQPFETFCVEKNEYIDFNKTFQVDIGVVARQGGIGGGTPDPLDAKTAYLYQEFINGTLDGYDFANSGIGRKESANALQAAIWYIEGEIGSVGSVVSGPEMTLAAKFVSDATRDATGIGRVRVLNLWSTNQWFDAPQDPRGRFLYQSLLGVVPAPGAVVLGVIGLGALAAGRRRFA